MELPAGFEENALTTLHHACGSVDQVADAVIQAAGRGKAAEATGGEPALSLPAVKDWIHKASAGR